MNCRRHAVWAVIALGAVMHTAEAQAPDSVLLSVATAVVAGAPAASSVWPGYVFPSEFIMCGPDGQTVLALEGGPPAHLGTPLRTMPMASQPRRINLHVFADRPPGLETQCIALEYPVADKGLLALPLLDSVMAFTGPLPVAVVGLFHETFHVFQSDHFANTRGRENLRALETRAWPPSSVVESPEFEGLAVIERELLVSALGMQPSDSLRSLLNTYLATRWTRLQMLPAEIRYYEAHEERKEATAHIVAHRAAQAVLHNALPAQVELIVAELLNAPRAILPRYGGWHYYSSGAAIATILDRLGVPWEAEIEGGATYEQLLTTAVSFDNRRAAELYETRILGRRR